MTIAAGFVCDDGVILCADTQETVDDYLKVRVPKLILKPTVSTFTENCKMAFAGAGDGPFINVLIEEMWKAAKRAGGDIDEIAEAVEKANKATHDEIWGIFGDVKWRPDADLLYAISTENHVRLYCSDGPVINTVPTYETIGSGGLLAQYIAAQNHDTSLNSRQTRLLALYLLEQAKRHADGCGGDSHILILKPGLKHEMVKSQDVATAASGLHNLDIVAKRLRLSAADLELTEEDFELEIQRCLAMVRDTRQLQKQFAEQLATAMTHPHLDRTVRREEIRDSHREPKKAKPKRKGR